MTKTHAKMVINPIATMKFPNIPCANSIMTKG